MTPYVTKVIVGAWNKNEEALHESRMIAAHAGAYLGRVKEFPTYEEFMNRVEFEEQDGETMWANIGAFLGETPKEEGAEDGSTA